MEQMGGICEGEWISLSGMCNSTEEADFMAQLLDNCPISTELDGSTSLGNHQSTFWPGHGLSTMNYMAGGHVNQNSSNSFFDVGNSSTTSSYCFSSQGSSSCYSGGSSVFFPSSSSQESCYYLSELNPILPTNNNSSSMSMDFCVGDANNTTSLYLVEGDHEYCSNQEMSDGNGDQDQSDGKKRPLLSKLESPMPAPEPVTEEKLNNPSEYPKKRSRNTADVQKNKRNVRSKKNQKAVTTSNVNQNAGGGLNRPTSSGCCSSDEDDSNNASQEPNESAETSSVSSKGKAAVNLNGKTRASRGSATDPQSLYARKRRERINERLRILQNLVPNGTKVDISTMLEEAVLYVKFLQLQIKLLSSDDLWMYAPIAYNGMNIGLDLKITTTTTTTKSS